MRSKLADSPSLQYPIDFRWFSSAALKGEKGKFLQDGTFLVYYGSALGWQVNPTSLAIVCLGMTYDWTDSNPKSRTDFIVRAGANLLNLAEKSDFVAFPFMFRVPGYPGRPPWYSALTQSFAASVFCRLAVITKDESWNDHARKAMDFILAGKGLSVFDKKTQGLWFEEAPETPPIHILNGHIYSLIGFWELYQFTGDKAYLTYFESGVKALSANVSLFDMNGLSYYDAVRKILAKPYYQKLHVEQMEFLYRTTGDPTFSHYAKRWKDNLSRGWTPMAWPHYIIPTLANGVRVDGLRFILTALGASMGENGINVRAILARRGNSHHSSRKNEP
jgi:hypothetical protein